MSRRRFAFVASITFLIASVALPAAAQRDIRFDAYSVPETGTVAIPVREGNVASGAFADLDAATGGALQRAVDASGFKGRSESKLDLPGIGNFDRVLLIGVGKDEVTPRVLEDFGGLVGQDGARSTAPRIEVLWRGDEAGVASHVAFGAALGQYRFDKYRSDSGDDDSAPRAGQGELVIRTPAGAAAAADYESQWKPVAEAVAFSRDLVTEPGNVIWPETFVERAREALDGLPNVTIEVLDEKAMERLGMGSILAVGQGSQRPPRMMVVRYNGGNAGDAPVAFVGKGITFDTGGISIKGSSGMWRMKYDMTGASVSVGAIKALAGRRAPVNAVAVAALAENMPSGTAARPGDVIRTAAGKTYEIMSTDAEGRMVLVDALWYVQDRDDPAVVIDIATLTGSIVGALGADYAGLFSRHDDLAAQLEAAGESSGDRVWRMPMLPEYGSRLSSPIADMRNGGGGPGAGTAAHFVGEWVDKDRPWAHLDIAGMAWIESGGKPTSPAGATAFGVRLFDEYVRQNHENQAPAN
ncbi:leucyl aminopeptidase [Luteimonas sp. A478]